MNREELALETEHLDLLDALAAAKAAHRADPTDDTRAALHEAKQAVAAFRAHWRGVRDAFAAPASDGDAAATPTTIKTKTRS